MKKVLLTSLLILTAHQALAADQTTTEETNAPHGLYIGGGISYNDLDLGSIVKGADNETAMGLQVFAGVPIANAIKDIDTFAEVGFFRTSRFDFGPGNKQKVVGVSGAVVLQRNLNEIDPNLYGLARIGYELGDDDGVFMGIGAGYRITPKVEVRAEFVNKDLVSSYQANALVRF
jgi:opacity protein-like surface antigen